jgi:hypothetical protein
MRGHTQPCLSGLQLVATYADVDGQRYSTAFDFKTGAHSFAQGTAGYSAGLVPFSNGPTSFEAEDEEEPEAGGSELLEEVRAFRKAVERKHSP